MPSGRISRDQFHGNLDLQTTLESGQTFLWKRSDNRMYEDAPSDDVWYSTVLPADGEGTEPTIIRVTETSDALVWESNVDAEWLVTSLLRLDDDVPTIIDTIRDTAGGEPLLEEAYDAHPGLRVVRSPQFPCLISFICSQQMQVGRIHAMQTKLARTLGDTVEFNGQTYHAFPRADQLAATTEDELRNLGLGYRAPYVKRTAEMVAADDLHPGELHQYEYETARDEIQQFVGVGNKVGDCVLLYALDFLEAVPIDTWIRSAVEDYFPECDHGSYTATSRALRDRWGAYAGYAQLFLFHYLRKRE